MGAIALEWTGTRLRLSRPQAEPERGWLCAHGCAGGGVIGFPSRLQFYLGTQLPPYSSCQAVSLGSHSCSPGWDRWSWGRGETRALTLSQTPGKPQARDPLWSESPFHIPPLLPASCEVWSSHFCFLSYVVQDGPG